jgi:CO dehydrogenase/acetyl-CoA synthase beta subunit
MNNLHVEYLRDTGKQPVGDTIYELWYHDKISEKVYDKISEKVYDKISAYSDCFCIYTNEYVEWLENKINNNLK